MLRSISNATQYRACRWPTARTFRTKRRGAGCLLGFMPHMVMRTLYVKVVLLMSACANAQLTDATIQGAVDNLDATGNHATHGHISSWDVSQVTDMANLFEDKTTFNQPINSWDVSRVTTMQAMFKNAAAFNQPLNSWDTSSVTDMNNMFNGAAAFNQPLNSWVTSSVTHMGTMFKGAAAFNQPLDGWVVSSVTNMGSMFLAVVVRGGL